MPTLSRTLVLAMFCFGGAVSPAPGQVTALTPDQQTEFARWWDVQDKVEVPYAKGGAKVLIVKFNDYQCPPCKQTYIAYEAVLAKFPPSDVKYLMKHFPLDPKCNSAVSGLVHAAACDASAAVVMARAKGTSDKLTAWFFAHQEELSPATVRRAAQDIGGIANFDAAYPAAIQEVKADGAAGGVLGVASTPTFFINGRRLKGGLPLQYFEAAIELELKRAK